MTNETKSSSPRALESNQGRRRFLQAAAATAGALPFAAALAGLQAGQANPSLGRKGFPGEEWARPRGPHADSGFGPLAPVADQTTGLDLLKLPRGFTYQSFGWTGDRMADGTLTPSRHDGMGVIERVTGGGRSELVLIRNHERGAAAPGDPLPLVGAGGAPIYDDFRIEGVLDGLAGGTTALGFSGNRFTDSRATLGGTLTNCAGGRTSWGSWLTCEETVIRGAAIGARDHGYVFEVPTPSRGAASAVPIKDMGFFPHEAVAVDPDTGYVYLTEDNGPKCGLYRFRPHRRPRRVGDLEQGGTLEMLAVLESGSADLRESRFGTNFRVGWVPIAEPDSDPEGFESPLPGFPPIAGTGRSGPFMQGEAQGGAFFARLEGCWYHDGVIYIVDTRGGPVGEGSVWALELSRAGSHEPDQLSAIFAATDKEAADNPDNVTVSPRGGVLLCEDGGGVLTRLLGLSKDGSSFPFAENNVVLDDSIPGKPLIEPGDYRGSEFAGATFAPDGRRDVMFVNIQTPGITIAIRGPWERGGL